MEGVKVLSKPADYDFAEAVDVYSENYYNLFAREVLNLLYNVYEDDSVTSRTDEDVRAIIYNPTETDLENGYKSLDTSNGYTYSSETSDDDQLYYLYDSLRYTITQVEKVYVDDNLESIVVEIDTNSAWNWTISNDAKDKEIVFLKASDVINSGNSFSFSGDDYDDWFHIYEVDIDLSSFSEFYTYGEDGYVNNKNDNVYYWISPYYNLTESGNIGDAVNYFQDALEYAVYLFVLGYDYYDYDDDAKYFEFTIVYDENGQVTDVLVGGWENEPISVSKGDEQTKSALARVKELYEALGGYVGLTEENKKQVADFIKDVIIGEDAYMQSEFTVAYYENGVHNSSGDLQFNRNYDAIINNIIEYACEKAPIGTSSDGEPLALDQAFLASQITDYEGNYFGPAFIDNSDDDIFAYIPAAEYQSIIIYPNEEDYGKAIGDLWLVFEYYDEDDPEGINYGKSITINVGLRYYNSSTGLINNGEGDYVVSITIDYEPLPTDNTSSDYEESYEAHFVTFSDTGTGTDYEIGDGFILSEFKKDIGNSAIDPYANSTGIDDDDSEYKSMLITAGSSAREYYMLNESSTYGFYGTLNYEKFLGECDYIEIFFDIDKEKGKVQNYDFKVAIYQMLAQATV